MAAKMVFAIDFLEGAQAHKIGLEHSRDRLHVKVQGDSDKFKVTSSYLLFFT